LSFALPRRRVARGAKAWLGFGFSGSIMVGGFFWPILGLAVPMLLAIAVGSTFFRRRWFCSNACPRGSLLSGFTRSVSRYRSLAPALYSQSVRMGLCGFLMFCAVGQTMHLWPSMASLGRFFWIVCIATFVVALIMAIASKPRAWCAVCPLGTLQDNISRAR
jgi:ferredoxin-type protein NapH